MEDPAPGDVDQSEAPTWKRWLDRPLSGWWCALGWLVSTTLYIAIVEFFYGPAVGDSPITTHPTWAIEHGQLTCAYPAHSVTAAPVYPLLAGGITAIARIGHSVAFPAGSALGAHCAKAATAYGQWAHHSNAQNETLRIGFITWFVLMAGVIALLRTSGRGRCGWEPTALVALACLPPLWMPIGIFDHPQDILAMGLGICAMACARRDSWLWAGILIGLAILSQQFAILIAVPLLILAPPARRLRFLIGAAAIAVVISLPFIVASAGHTTHDVLLGSGATASDGGTLVAHLRLLGGALFVVSRICPVVISLVLSIYVVRRRGREAAFEPVAFVSLITLSLSMRLVFEASIYGYYFMALAVALVLLEVIRGFVRPAVVVWLVVVSLYCLTGTFSYAEFWRFGWQRHMQALLSPVAFSVAVLLLAFTLARKGLCRDVLLWLAFVLGVLFVWPTVYDPLSYPFTTLDWQIVLVIPGVVLAASPLRPKPTSLEPPPPSAPGGMREFAASR